MWPGSVIALTFKLTSLLPIQVPEKYLMSNGDREQELTICNLFCSYSLLLNTVPYF